MGYDEGSNTYRVISSQGALRGRSIKRSPESERWSETLLDYDFSVLQPTPHGPGEERLGIRASIQCDPLHPDDDPGNSGRSTAPRAALRTRLLKKDFEDYG